jgi:Flp pilus assembly protein TadG
LAPRRPIDKPTSGTLARLLRIATRFRRDERGNMAIIAAICAMPMLYLVGMGTDYGIAAMRQEQLNAYADAAALAAVTPTMMAQATSVGKTAAQNTFNAQSALLKDVKSITPTVTISTAGSVRTVTVSYTAAYQTMFPQILSASSMGIAGSSTATGGLAPNIDFYMLLDDSPSMAIAATQQGINTMVANTGSQGGCAFACHETHPSSDNLGNPGGIDNYQLARNLNVTLRMDLVKTATQSLMDTAASSAATSNAAYRFAIYTFDTAVTRLRTLTANLTKAKTAAGNIALMTVYANSWLTSTNNNNDTDTNFDTAFSTLNTAMPAPGSGTNNTGDKPQEVLYMVTDGLEDEQVGSNRQISVPPASWCTTIKARGIRIAVLYTEYLPLPTNWFYNTYVAPFQSTIGTSLTNCASPGLYFKVTTGGDITAAMAALFNLTIQSAYLSK